jgi:hypothetical protein
MISYRNEKAYKDLQTGSIEGFHSMYRIDSAIMNGMFFFSDMTAIVDIIHAMSRVNIYARKKKCGSCRARKFSLMPPIVIT